jgi:triacylglycerol esterase/lipase EstA (alpha/beta hydrolase family)/CHAT domain-containing protein
LRRGQVKNSVIVGAQRGISEELRLTAVPGQDAVVIEIAGGPALVLSPENARDLVMAQQGEGKGTRGGNGAKDQQSQEIRVPIQLQWRGLEDHAGSRGATRGFLGDVLIAAIHIVTGIGTGKAADLVAEKVVERFDHQVDEGLYQLGPEKLSSLKGSHKAAVPAAANGKPLLVFVHGTFSDTSGTFGKLWSQHPSRVRTIFDTYGNRVYGLDHATLGSSPIANALSLAKAVPQNAALHLVTHSRGGLVAEVLAKVCGNPDAALDGLKLFPAGDDSDQQQELSALVKIVKTSKLRVERVVRVACPARGTLLASKRLDAYLSVFKWTLELAGIPVASALVDFLGEVAQRRADPSMIPGLAAQIPDSPLVQWIHATDKPIDGQLRVVAGDIEGDSVVSWLKTLLADAFYWTDNDLVVHTSAMYGGTPRATDATFVFDQGGKVSHFNYFSNDATAEAITRALIDEAPVGFRTIGPLSYSGKDSTGVRAPRRMAGIGQKASERPAVFLLPGVLGSNLQVGGKRIWLSWRFLNRLSLLTYKPDNSNAVRPDGPIGLVYDRLADFLSETHEVIEFAFDWRKPMEEEARRLAEAVDRALAEREKSGQPVRILAHSMGGLVARVLQLERPDVWRRMMANAASRMVMLGTPNGGSWVPMQVLSGDDTFGNTLVAFGAPFNGRNSRQLMAEFPGLLQLQAGLLDLKLGLDKAETWKELATKDLNLVRGLSWWHDPEKQVEEYEWGLPTQKVLDQAVALRKRLDQQRDEELAPFRDRLLLVAGRASLTPDGYEVSDEGLSYREVQDAGDGRVTLASAQLPGLRTWIVNCEHGKLPSETESFKAYRELLEAGTTTLLTPVVETAGRGTAALLPSAYVLSRPSRARAQVRPPEATREVLSSSERERQPVDAKARGAALRITVVNGDLRFVRHALMIGHYRSMSLTGSEWVMNTLVDGLMEESLNAGLYPDSVRSHQVFLNTRRDPESPRQMPWPESVVVVGLGEEGKLRAMDLIQAVRQATIAWAQRVTEKAEGAPALFDLAATLIGSGGISISPGQSAQLVAEGVRQANQLLAESLWPQVGHLHLIEIYHDRASEAWRALQVQATATPTYYEITETIQPSPGAYGQTPDQGYRGADYDFITVLSQRRDHDTILSYALDTKRAATEVRAQATQGRLLEILVSRASNDRNTDLDIRRALFRLLVPIELEAFLGGASEMVIELDQHTAGIPWELLDTDVRGGGDKRPWAIRSKLVRKLRTEEIRQQIMDASAEAPVLVIGEPECNRKYYPRLPGARAEAKAVYELLTGPSGLDANKVKALIGPDDPDQVGPDALTVTNTLFSRDWRIVHIAGHGEPPQRLGPKPEKPDDPPQKEGDPRGVVLSDYTYLGPREIKNMRVVPELVFVNCCHLAARNIAQLTTDDEPRLGRPYSRPEFAATVAGQLIKIGVRCVIAAGWAVDDAAAMQFAVTFYRTIIRGGRFIDAVGEARKAAWEESRKDGREGNTWAAYQCYGDPDWTLRRETADAQRPRTRPAEKFAGIASPSALVLALHNLAVDCQYFRAPVEVGPRKQEPRTYGFDREEQRARLRYLEEQFGTRWAKIGSVAEAFGWAWQQAGDISSACSWYERALKAYDATASIKAIEQLNNLKVRQAWKAVKQSIDRRDEARRQLQELPRRSERATRSAQVRRIEHADQEVKKTARSARTLINEAIVALQKLVAVETSLERESLLGSAYKRLAMIDAVQGRRPGESLRRMKEHYQSSENLARGGNLSELFYPALNRMAAELVLNAGRTTWKGFDPAALAAVRQSLESKMQDDPDFWAAVGLIELNLYETLARPKPGAALEKIGAQYEELHQRVSASWMWGSVRDQSDFVLLRYKATGSADERAIDNLRSTIKRLAPW